MSSIKFCRSLLLVARATGVYFGEPSRKHRYILCFLKKSCQRVSTPECGRTSFLVVPMLAVFVESGKNIQQLQKQNADISKPVRSAVMIPDVREIKKRADSLHRKYKEAELYSFLKQYGQRDDAEIQWRLARAAHAMGKRSVDRHERKALMVEAFEYAKRALDTDCHNSNCHKWYAILLDQTAQLKGFRARLSSMFTVKKHFEKAIELNPNDALSLHSVGRWCFAVADLNWYERKLTEALFPCPPRSTYEEALVYFERAERADPRFFSMNYVMLGKTHLRLGNYNTAVGYLTQACGFPLCTPDDEVAHNEASHLLRKLGHTPCIS